jgi:2',3'-cyclic-nucleotide 2'-phosphodiesterase (5'-nucleotidase family)
LILLDGGDFGEAVNGRNVWKTAELFKTLRSFGYDAIGLGERDLASAFFAEASQNGVKEILLSGNFRPAVEIGAPPIHLIQRESYKVGVVAAVSPFYQQGHVLEPKDPKAFLQEQLPALRKKKADVLVVIYHGPANEALALQQSLPEVDLWLLSHGIYQPLNQVPTTAGAIVVGPGDRGREVGLIVLQKDKKSGTRSATFSQIILDHRIPDSPKIEAIRENFRIADQAAARSGSNNK